MAHQCQQKSIDLQGYPMKIVLLMRNSRTEKLRFHPHKTKNQS